MSECIESRSVIDWVARTRVLAPRFAEASARIERAGRVPEELMAVLHEAGLFRLCLPRALGGAEASPMTMAAVLEALAGADASTAWCLGQGLGCSLVAGFVAPEIAERVFGPPGAVLAWGPSHDRARAVRVDGGYRLTGRWHFASGIRNATWLGAHAPVYAADGRTVPVAPGRPRMRTFLFPKDRATVYPVWETIGLQGTGSDDYAVEDLFVADEYSYSRDLVHDRNGPTPVHRIPHATFYAMGFAGVALGIARTLLDSFMELAAEKTPSYAKQKLRDNPAVQQRVAWSEGNLSAARAFLFEMLSEHWELARERKLPTLRQRARLRIACTYASQRAREVADFAYHAAGSSAVHRRGPFERRFRDMNAVAQQIQAAPSNFEHAGLALFGIEPDGRV